MKILFKNGYVWDGEKTERKRADVLINNQHVEAVVECPGMEPAADTIIVDATEATVMPALVESHGHLSFPPNLTYFTQLEDTPVEELVLATVANARLMLDHEFTAVIGAGSPRLRVELAVRNEINAGRIPGPRLLASTPTLTATGGLNDTAQIHQGRSPCAMVIDGPTEARKAVRTGYREGVDVIKVNISGDDLVGRPPGRTVTLAADEVAAIAETARPLGLKLIAHARATDAIKSALRNGFDIVHHADFCDAEAFDLFEERRTKVYATPAIGFLHNLRYEAEAFGFTPQTIATMGLEQHMEATIRSHIELRKRGIKVLIGGDYGLTWQPHGTNARDIEHFVHYLGYSPIEALRCATRYGFEAMGLGADLGLIRPGYIADILLVAGDPTTDVTVLQKPTNLLCIMKEGVFHKAPPASLRASAAA